MRDLTGLEKLNSEHAAAYRERTTARERLKHRLESLAITSAAEKAAILAGFDQASEEAQRQLEDMEVALIRKMLCRTYRIHTTNGCILVPFSQP